MKEKHVGDHKISVWLDGELSPQESEAVSQHLGQCRECQSRLLDWQRIDHYLRSTGKEISTPPFLEQKILAHVKRKSAVTADRSRSWLSPLGLRFRIATVGLAGLGIMLGIFMGVHLTPLLTKEREQIDIIAVLSSQDTHSPSITTIALDFITEGES